MAPGQKTGPSNTPSSIAHAPTRSTGSRSPRTCPPGVITPPDIILSLTARLNANETQERNWALHVRKRSGSGLVLGWNWAVSGMPKIAVCDR